MYINHDNNESLRVRGSSLAEGVRVLLAVSVDVVGKPAEEFSWFNAHNSLSQLIVVISLNICSRTWASASVKSLCSAVVHFQLQKRGLHIERESALFPRVFFAIMAAKAGAKKITVDEQRKIVSELNEMRQEQRELASKEAEMEMELNEHRVVLEALKGMEGSRKCFRMVGGVLVERTVGDVLPALQHNEKGLVDIIGTLNKQVEEKGRQITAFREKHSIQIQGERSEEKKSDDDNSSQAKPGAQGLLVAS